MIIPFLLQTKNMPQKSTQLLLLALLLTAFQCGKDDGYLIDDTSPTQNDFKINLNLPSDFSVGDTLWIVGDAVAKVLAPKTNDSIISPYAHEDYFLLMQFIPPKERVNSIEGIQHFEVIPTTGTVSFLPRCENAQMNAHAILTADSLHYRYQIGLKALKKGDYVLSWLHSEVLNKDINKFIFQKYSIPDFPDELGFSQCEQFSWRPIQASNSEFYFRVH